MTVRTIRSTTANSTYSTVVFPGVPVQNPRSWVLDRHSADTATDVRRVYELEDLYHPDYSLIRPLVLSAEVGESGEVVLSHASLNVYGAGDTPEEAAQEFSIMAVDILEELGESRDMLSVSLSEQLRLLESFIVPR